MANMTRNIPLSVDDELLAEIDRVAEATKESRSAVMRRAIREGLPITESGSKADVLALDGETSRDADSVSKETGVSRAKILIESIRTGLQATYYRLMRDKWIRAQDKNPKDKETEAMILTLESSAAIEDPMGRELRAALRQRGAAIIRFHDLLVHVPEAWERYEDVEKLTDLRRKAGTGPGVWGAGLSNEEIKWQIAMAEKYGVGANLPQEEIDAREAARKSERDSESRKHRSMAEDVLANKPFPER